MGKFKKFISIVAIISSMAIFITGSWIFFRIGRYMKGPVKKIYAGKSERQKRPIILVHGLNRTGRIWLVAGAGNKKRFQKARSMAVFLRENGYPNIYINTFPDTRNTSLFKNANNLKKWIEETKKHFQAKEVDIIAHSLGGLISRAYLQEINRNDAKSVNPLPYSKDVNRLIMIAIPHLGSPLADSFASIFDWYALRTLREGGGADLQFLNQRPLPCQPRYYSILASSSKNSQKRNWGFWRLLRFLLSYSTPLDGDGIVSLKSQNLINAVPHLQCFANPHRAVLVKMEKNFKHRNAVKSLSIQRTILNILNGTAGKIM